MSLQHPLCARMASSPVVATRRGCRHPGLEYLGPVVIVLPRKQSTWRDARIAMASDWKTWVMFSVAMVPIRSAKPKSTTDASRPKVHGDSCGRRPSGGTQSRSDGCRIGRQVVDGLAQYQRTVFAGVVAVDIEVSSTAKRQVEAGVASECCQHVVEEADSGLYIRPAGAVDVQREGDIRLAGSALKGGSSWSRGVAPGSDPTARAPRLRPVRRVVFMDFDTPGATTPMGSTPAFLAATASSGVSPIIQARSTPKVFIATVTGSGLGLAGASSIHHHVEQVGQLEVCEESLRVGSRTSGHDAESVTRLENRE